jgi:hypothetical protein
MLSCFYYQQIFASCVMMVSQNLKDVFELPSGQQEAELIDKLIDGLIQSIKLTTARGE